jgi:putative DNA primase/helicase
MDLPLLRGALTTRCAELAIALLGDPNRAMSSKREVRFGRHGSLAVVIAGPKAGLWRDHETGTGGDMLGLIMAEHGIDFRAAMEVAEHFLGRPAAPVEIQRPRRQAPERDTAEAVRYALNVWREAMPIKGTLAECYLAGRGLTNPEPGIDGALRFHPHCPWRDTNDRIIKIPALIGLYRHIHTDEPRAINRRALTNDGHKIDKPKALGPKAGCAIKLSTAPEVTHRLTIGEGIETTLAGMALGYVPAWAVGDAGELAAFPVLNGVESLTILVDHDKSGAGQRAAVTCSARWTGAGREVFRLVPRQAGTDANDLLMRVLPKP